MGRRPEEGTVENYTTDPDKTAPSYPEPPEATAVPPESKGQASWECLTCGRTFDEDLGTCPEDGAPLRKVGPLATPQIEKMRSGEMNITAEKVPQDEGREAHGKPGSAGHETEGGNLQGERPAPPRGPGEDNSM